MGFFRSNEKKLLEAIEKDNIEKTKSIIKKANKRYKIININEKDENNHSFIYLATFKNNTEMVKILIEYANSHKFVLKLNEKDEDGLYPLVRASFNNNTEIVELLIEYAYTKDIALNINDKTKYGEYPIYCAAYRNNLGIIKLLMEYSNINNIVMELNEKNKYKYYPLYWATYNNNIEMVKILIEYSKNNNIILNIDEKNKNGNYPLLWATSNNNIEMVKLLIEYANTFNIIMKLNEKNKNGNYPLLYATSNNNVEMVNLLFEYANTHDIYLKFNEDDIKDISKINQEIINMWRNYEKQEVEKTENENENEIEERLEREISKKEERIEKQRSEKIDRGISQREERIAKQRSERLERSVSRRGERIEKKKSERFERRKSQRGRNQRGINQRGGINQREKEEGIEKKKSERFERGISQREERIEKKKSERLERGISQREERIEKKKSERLERGISQREERIGKKKSERMERRKSQRRINQKEEKVVEIVKRKSEKEEQEKMENEKSNVQVEVPTLVIAINDFITDENDQLTLRKDEFLVVTNWNYEENWVYGYRKDNEDEKGSFPKDFIKIYIEENIGRNVSKNEISKDYKIKKFEKKIKKLRSLKEMRIVDEGTEIFLHRNNVFNDAFNIIMNKSRSELKDRILIKYIGEQGTDAGGLLREFFYQISKEIGDPKYSLFRYPNDNSYELEIIPNFGDIDPNYLKYYTFIGLIIGLAILHKEYLSVTFTTLFCKKLLNKQLEFSDLEYVDPELFKNLKQLKNINGVEDLYLTFSIDVEDGFGNFKNVELKPNGSNIDVTDLNKDEYIDLMVRYKLRNTYDTKQLNALKKGFYEIIPRQIGNILDGIDLKYLISGTNELDVDDWENNTDYEDYKKKDITIINFWKCVREFDNENRKNLLLFATGNSQVPVTGFKDLQGNGNNQHFCIKKFGTPEDLPKSHTCFNCIDLPPYTSYTQMKQKLLLAITEGMGYFSMD